MNKSTKKWLRQRKLDVFFLYLECIAVTILGYSLVLRFSLFVLELKIYACFALLVGILEIIYDKISKNKG